MTSFHLWNLDLPVPSGWDAENISLTPQGKLRPDDFLSNIIINKGILGEDETFEDYAKRSQAALRNTLSDFILIDEQSVDLGGCQARKLTYKFKANGALCKQMQCLILSGNQVVIFTATDASNRFEPTRCTLEAMLAGLKVENKNQPADTIWE